MAENNYDFRSGRNPFGDSQPRIGRGQSYQPERNRQTYQYSTNGHNRQSSPQRQRQQTSAGRPQTSANRQRTAPVNGGSRASVNRQTGRPVRPENQRKQTSPPKAPGSSVSDAQAKGMAVNRFFRNWTIRESVDPLLLILVFVLLCIGLVMMFSASYTHSYYDKNGDALWYFRRQLLFAGFGVVVMLLVSKFNFEKLNSIIAPIAYFASLGLLMLTFIINLRKESDFKRWLDLGFISFQPSEIGKFTLILFLAYCMAKSYGLIQSNKIGKDNVKLRQIDERFTSKIRGIYKNASTMSMYYTLMYTFIISAMCLMVIIENHISCTILIFAMGVCMMWLGGVKKGYFIILAVVVAVAVVYVVKNPDILPGYAGERIVVWLDKEYEPLGSRWQTNQSLRAIASGGPFGLGLGNSRQKHMYVSEPQNDFIFAIICEELGFVGGTIIICLFAALVWRAFHIAANVKSTFGALLIMGIALQIGIQVLVNIAVVTDTIPNTGISLPFFSYGGTSLVILLAEMGIALSVSRTSTIQKV